MKPYAMFGMLIAATVAGCAAPVTSKNVDRIVTAKHSVLQPLTNSLEMQGLTDVFPMEGSIHACCVFSGVTGYHIYSARWYTQNQLRTTTAPIVEEYRSLYQAIATSSCVTLGPGTHRVEFVVDGNVVGSKTFTVLPEGSAATNGGEK